MRRYTRLSNGFSRKLENHAAATALNYSALFIGLPEGNQVLYAPQAIRHASWFTSLGGRRAVFFFFVTTASIAQENSGRKIKVAHYQAVPSLARLSPGC